MTAKFMKQCAAIYTGTEQQPILWRYQFKEAEFKAFCEQLCKEQLGKVLQLCKFSSDGNYYYATKEEILNAPMPEL